MEKKLKLNRSIESTIIEEVVVEQKAKENNQNLDSLGRSYGTGRRKESVARLWFKFGEGASVNGTSFENYFQSDYLCHNVMLPLKLLNLNSVSIYATVFGGGKKGQSDALRLALSKALLMFDSSFKTILKANGLLTTDNRKKEREHIGYRSSRVPQQYCRR